LIRVAPLQTPTVTAIPLPLPHIGSVNAWLLRGEPLTLLDAGPSNEEALSALEVGLRRAGVRLADIELVLATHHHLDHVGLAGAVKRASGASIAVLASVADYAADYHRNVDHDRAFSERLMAAHGVPDAIIGDDDLWDFVRANGAGFAADVRLAEGDRIRAGGRDLEVLARPGHSPTDTLFVDARERLAFVGDHLLAGISSNTEISPVGAGDGGRPQPRTEYLRNLQLTAALQVDTLLTGHGAPVKTAPALVELRLAEHRRRAARIAAILMREPQSAYRIAEQLWPPRTVRQQPLLVVWEVLGHLETLMSAGLVSERVEDGGRPLFALSYSDDVGRISAGVC
jgi:glyoxylase-like metal-dependent hydrolase (beta-lactamase superfamily II)